MVNDGILRPEKKDRSGPQVVQEQSGQREASAMATLKKRCPIPGLVLSPRHPSSAHTVTPSWASRPDQPLPPDPSLCCLRSGAAALAPRFLCTDLGLSFPSVPQNCPSSLL